MQPRFQVTTTFNRDSYHARVTADYVSHHKPHTAIFYGVLLALGAFFWWGAVFASGATVSPLYAAIYGAALLGVCLLSAPYLERLSVKNNVARMLKSTLKKAKDLNAESVMHFADEGFALDIGERTMEQGYTALSALIETRNFFVLLKGDEFFFTMAKKGFTLGTVDAFRGFLEEKSGQKFKFLDF